MLRKAFESQLPRWVTCVSGNAENWGPLIQTLEVEGDGYVRGVKFSPDGEKLIFVSADPAVRIWDSRTGTLLHTLQDKDLSQHNFDDKYLYFLFNGQKIAFVWPNIIKVWDVIFESWIQKIEGNDIVLVALSPVEQKLASGSSNGAVRVWDVTSGMPLQTFRDCAGNILSLEFSPNGQKLAAKFRDPVNVRVLLWDLDSDSLLQTIRIGPSQRKFYSLRSIPLAFSRDGKIIACGSGFNTIGIWDAESGAALQTLSHFSIFDFKGISFLPNEQHLAFWDYNGNVQVWNVPDGSLLRTFCLEFRTYGDHPVAFSPTGQNLASSPILSGTVQVWDIAFNSPPSQKLQGHKGFIIEMVLSPDGQKLASLSSGFEICLWDVATGSLRKRFIASGYDDLISCDSISIAFSVDGVKLLTLKSQKNILDVWDTESGQSLKLEHGSLINLHDTTKIPVYGVSLIDQWVTLNQQRLIRVPPGRHGSELAISGTKVAIGAHSGVVTLLDLDLELMESSIAWPPAFKQEILAWRGYVYGSHSASEDDNESSDIEYLGQRERRRE